MLYFSLFLIIVAIAFIIERKFVINNANKASQNDENRYQIEKDLRDNTAKIIVCFLGAIVFLVMHFMWF